MTISPFARWLISTYDWRTAMLTIGILVWVLLIPAALSGAPARPRARRRLPRSPGQTVRRVRHVGGARRSAHHSFGTGADLLLCCAAHSGPIFHMVSYAIGCGVPAMAAVTVYSVEGLSGLGGRLAAWRACRPLAASRRVLIAGLAGAGRGDRQLPVASTVWPSSMRSRSCSAPPMAASCRSMPCWRANTSASTSWGRCSAPPP